MAIGRHTCTACFTSHDIIGYFKTVIWVKMHTISQYSNIHILQYTITNELRTGYSSNLASR